MTRRVEAGPLLATLGALLLLVSLFLAWFDPDITAWEAFEAWDVVLFALALVAVAAGMGLTAQDVDLADRRALPAVAAAVLAIVGSQIVNPPPAAAGQAPEIGAWLALGAAVVMCAGAVLTLGRLHVAVELERRRPRHVAAVDARGPKDQTTESNPVVSEQRPAGQRLFARGAGADTGGDGDPDTGDDSQPVAEAETEPQATAVTERTRRTRGRTRAAGNGTPEQKQG
jgi:hypothetical protein